MGCPDENTLLAFVEGRLSPPTRDQTAQHVESCSSCGDVVAGAAPVLLTQATTPMASPPGQPRPPLARGAAIGRYVVLSLVGRGGMGEVYAAYDPELDRRVALKLLHEGATRAESGGLARLRLLREAKAIARLAHPNVVVVHDAGTVDDRVFIAMEFVEGETLAAWLKARPRGWREVRDLFLAAGRALGAAHAAGIIHRDFKPQNVMVASDDGAIKVMDFGLAKTEFDGEEGADPADPSAARLGRAERAPGGSGTLSGSPKTMTAILGTPAYMAPEQFAGERVDPRADQFSFCVALYEALYGERPFDDRSVGTLAAAVTAGTLREVPSRARVPAWLRRVVTRGLRPKRDDRYPSMADLLRELGRDPQRRQRRALAAVGVAVALLAGGAVAQRAASRDGVDLCRSGAEKLAGVWELSAAGGAPAPRHEATRARFLATGKSFAADAWTRAAATLDAYAGRWTAAYADACQATHVRGEQSEQVLDLRMECLKAALGSVKALTDLFTTADGTVVSQAIDAADGLPRIDRCNDVALLRASVPPPEDPAKRARVADLRRRIDVARTLRATGRFRESFERLGPLVAEARDGDYPPVLAEALQVMSALEYDRGNAREVELAGKEAFRVALGARDDDVAAQAAVRLYDLYAIMNGQADPANTWAELADAVLNRLGPGHEWLRAELTHNRGTFHMLRRELTLALPLAEQAVAEKTRAYGPDHPQVAISLGSLGDVLGRLQRAQPALDAYRRALDISVRAYGPSNPALAVMHYTYGTTLAELGRPAEAIATFQRTVELWEAEFGPDLPRLAYPLTGIGRGLLALGRDAEALPLLERALRLRDRGGDPDPIPPAETRFALARALWPQRAQRARALALAREARAAYAAVPTLTRERDAIDAWLAERPSARGASAK